MRTVCPGCGKAVAVETRGRCRSLVVGRHVCEAATRPVRAANENLEQPIKEER